MTDSGPTGDSPTGVLGGREAILLGNAFVAATARRQGIRTLLVKGVVAELSGLRPRRPYADIDVLVDPKRFNELQQMLGEVGWQERMHLWVFDRLETHSVTLIHRAWPVDLDLHRRFPGFLADDETVFEELWSRRKRIRLAGQPVMGTDDSSTAAVLALHALRSMHASRSAREFAGLLETLRARPDLLEGLLDVAAATGSSQTLRPLFDALGVVPKPSVPVSEDSLAAWRRRVSHPSRTGVWVTYLKGVPRRQWPREVIAVVWPSPDEYLQEHPEVARSTWALFVARSRRLLLGARGLVTVLRSSSRRRGHAEAARPEGRAASE